MTTRTAAAVDVSAPAKINLALHVTGQRGDGYHLIDSLVTFAGVGDRLSFAAANEDGFTLSGRFADTLPHHDDPETGNLVLRARNLLRGHAREKGLAASPVAIHLEKALPPASGIGGGSADAAATLIGLNRLWALGFSADQLSSLGLQLGADVPMCLQNRPLVARGIGEDISLAHGFPTLALVLVNPLEPVSTPAVFRSLEHRSNAPLCTGPLPVSPDGWHGLIEESRNDLQAPASRLAPVIHSVVDALYSAGATLARMSGSGATCFGLFPDITAAEKAAKAVYAAYPEWYVKADMTVSGGA